VQSYGHFGQQFAYASSAEPSLQQGGGCLGDSTLDPVGATFDQVYNGHFFYVLWNDQFYGDPMQTEDAPKGHSKGMLAWDNAGNGFVMQVSTPDWPGSGSSQNPRGPEGNSLGCIRDNDVKVSQHFFALKLTKADVIAVLNGLANASVVTDPKSPQIVRNGGPPEIQSLAASLGNTSTSKTVVMSTLSSGVQLISKASHLNVPPWQMVSAMLGGPPLRVASWWTRPEIPSTSDSSPPACWDPSLGKPGPVQIATSGAWNGATIGLQGMDEPEGNHAKVGVSTGDPKYSIFGDMNQQGTLSGPKCDSSQNGRGGLFYVIDNATLAASVGSLIKGDSAPAR
jgi:Deoxyribonuclease II